MADKTLQTFVFNLTPKGVMIMHANGSIIDNGNGNQMH